MEVYVGTVCAFGFNYAPAGWAMCQGQIMAISQNTALFSLLGVNYGGNGTSTFGLPNLMGNAAIGFGDGPGLSQYAIGETGGATSTTLTQLNLPTHNHAVSVSLNANGARGTVSDPTNAFVASPDQGENVYAGSPDSNVFLGGGPIAVTMAPAGGNSPISIQRPYLVMNYSISLYGIFPPRS